MKMYVRIESNEVAEYPLSERNLVARGLSLDAAGLEELGYFPVLGDAAPAASSSQRFMKETMPVYDDALGAWVKNWIETDKPTSAIAKELAADKAKALEGIKQNFSQAMQMFVADVSTEERETWVLQKEAAEAFKAGRAKEVQIQLLQAIAVGGESVDILCDKIINKSNMMSALVGLALNTKRSTEKAVESANSIEEIAAIIEAARVRMAVQIAQLMAG